MKNYVSHFGKERFLMDVSLGPWGNENIVQSMEMNLDQIKR